MRAHILRLCGPILVAGAVSPSGLSLETIADTSEAPAALTVALDREHEVVTGSSGRDGLGSPVEMVRLLWAQRRGGASATASHSRNSAGGLPTPVFLREVDLAFAQADILENIEQTILGDFACLSRRIDSVPRLHTAIVDMVAWGGPFGAQSALAGKPFSIGASDSGTQTNASAILRDRLGVDAPLVAMGNGTARKNLVSSNREVGVLSCGAGRGSWLVADISAGLGDRTDHAGRSFVSFQTPPDHTPYIARFLTSDDCSSVIARAKTVAGWAIPPMLATYDRVLPADADTSQPIRGMTSSRIDEKLKFDDGRAMEGIEIACSDASISVDTLIYNRRWK